MGRIANEFDLGSWMLLAHERLKAKTSARWATIIASLIAAVFCLGFWQATAQAQVANREAKIKAVYCYQFFEYVQWPQAAWGPPEQPLFIGSVGDDPVNPILRAIAAKRKVRERKLVFLPVKSLKDAKRCHILFIADSADPTIVKQLMGPLQNAPVLIVGDDANTLDQGAVIAFRIVNNNVRLLLSTQSAKARQLKIRSQLAKLATIVD